ncbi:hypothetical protein LAZ67_8003407 [Cordylochernes scorpioides]|uniref:DUF5641 domain-containing protein n=1 Tax=Cordylochernes scorpioides TaxID=51811 RepID=A0ABY6KT39_9ARAC|nr:hypothetical protein LAZ67_8003407 [Cordylochernes scorpioides]
MGDMVLIGQESLKRLHWPLARIIQLYLGKGRLVRLRTAHQETQTIGSTILFLIMFESSRRQLKGERNVGKEGVRSSQWEADEGDYGEAASEMRKTITEELVNNFRTREFALIPDSLSSQDYDREDVIQESARKRTTIVDGTDNVLLGTSVASQMWTHM